jgi:transposase
MSRAIIVASRYAIPSLDQTDEVFGTHTQRLYDFALYCERNLVERFFNQLKHFRAVATRYDKLARTFLAGVQLAAAMILLN